MATDFIELAVSLRYFLREKSAQDRSYAMAGRALELGLTHHIGLRKDGVTPEFRHQLEIAQYLRTLAASLMYPAETLAAAFLHDLCEDYGDVVSFEYVNHHYGPLVGQAVRALTKTYRGAKYAPADVVARQAACPIASVVKGADRVNNQNTMIGVFTPSKIQQYIVETESQILPMIARAKGQFEFQYEVYENIDLMLKTQLAMLQVITQRDDQIATLSAKAGESKV